jgi:rhodanese-related sulfurtransferase/molybdopterin-guanine dinucleotide biosynthesis protein A
MGRDKALLVVDGVPMALRVAAALRAAGAAEVMAVGGDPAALGRLGLAVVADDVPGGGPLPATITAIRQAGGAVVVVLSCDLLHPDPDAVAAVVDALAAAGPEVVGAVPVVDGHHQWTHAAWRSEALAALLAAQSAGARSLRRAAATLVLAEVQGLPPASVADADTPDDLTGVAVGVFQQPGSLRAMDIPEIDVAELAVQRSGGALLIDVREPDEFAGAHVPGAELIPLGEVVERVDDVSTTDTVYVICATGSRSAKAVEFYRKQGIDAVNVAGGTLAWINAGHATDIGAGNEAGGA